jgi:ribonucleoside-diphosphate reductase alpha chain
MLALLNIDHKDILKFIACKTTEGMLANMNVSVGITDDFMQKVKSKDPKSIELWDKIIDNAWNNGEPGVVYLDTVNAANPVPHMGKIKSGNPCSEFLAIPFSSCLRGDTVVLSEKGVRQIKNLVKTHNNYILSSDIKFRKYNSVISKGMRPTFKLTLDGGLSINATSDHLFETDKGFKKLSDIDIGDEIKLLNKYPLSSYGDYDELYEMFGWMHGDGWYTKNSVGISFNHGDKDTDAMYRLLPIFHKVFETTERKPLKNDEESYQIQTETNRAMRICKENGFIMGLACEKELPKFFFQWTLKQQISFMRGLFGSDGMLLGPTNSQIGLVSSSSKLMEQVQVFLAALGIQSRLYTTKFSEEIHRKPQYKCTIGKESANTFVHIIGFSSNIKNKKFTQSNYKDNNFSEVISIESAGEFEVFDIVEVSETNTFFANGISVHNCNLGSLNLFNFYKDKDVDWVRLEKAIRLGVRFLDNVISVNWFPLPEIKDITLKTRPIGLGLMGFADLLLKLEVRYDSGEGLAWAEKIMEFINRIGHDESVKIGKEKGSFPEFKKTKLSDKYEALRNSIVTVVAPTGSLSMIAGTSSGIEPNFSWNTEMHRIDTVMEQIHPLALKYLKSKEVLPNYFVTASEISPEWHVRILAAFQKHVDSGISKTIILPFLATKEDVAKVYNLAWELKIKGVTIYREGSRTKEVLINKAGKKETPKNQKKIELIYRERDEDLTGVTRKAKTGCGNSYITVNFDSSGYPIEVFKQVSSKGGCEAMSEGLARMCSLALRNGISIDEIIRQLKSVKCSNAIGKNIGCNSCPDLMGKTLQNLMGKKEELKKITSCPDCGGTLETAEGCIHCSSCGFSKCS